MIQNFLLFQLGWFASVLGASRQTPWLGVLVVGLILIVHLATRGTPRELLSVATSAMTGVLADSFLLHAGLVSYESPTSPGWLAPAWIVAMWANFAITLRHSLAWLAERPVLAAILGAIAGPLAYWGAARLGAVQVASPILAGAVLALVWAAAVPALLRVSNAMSKKYLIYS